MILRCTYEEMTALRSGTARASAAPDGAPVRVLTDLESLGARLGGDLTIETLADVRSVVRAVEHILASTRSRTDHLILAQHPAAEDAVTSYFEYAHILTFLDRARKLEAEISALIELMTGAPPTEEAAVRVTFDD